MEFPEDDGSSDLAGHERCRTDLWGHASVKELGAIMLPSLAHGDIYAEGPAIDRLEREVKLVLTNITAIVKVTGHEESYVSVRAQNILAAIQRARALGGGVVIW